MKYERHALFVAFVFRCALVGDKGKGKDFHVAMARYYHFMYL